MSTIVFSSGHFNQSTPGLESYFYPGYCLEKVETIGREAYFHLRPIGPALCPRCGNKCEKVHETRMRRVREAPTRASPESTSTYRRDAYVALAAVGLMSPSPG